MIEAAHQWFRLPLPGPQLEIVRADAGIYVARPRVRGRFGVIQVDLYDQDAAGPVLDSEAFYGHCHAALDSPGIMAVNLFGRHASFKRSLARIAGVFDQVVTLAPRDEGNLVVLGLKGPPLQATRKELFERAGVVQARYRLPARGWVRSLPVAVS